jgi:hypothetical protein
MTRTNLLRAGREKLERIAQQHGVDFTDETTGDQLVDLILEASEESRREWERMNSNPVRIQEKKYEISEDADLVPPGEEDQYPIPDRYNETRIALLLRDPAWAFAYWDIHDNLRAEYTADDPFPGVLLRVCELDADEVVDSFDIPVKLTDGRWYINLPRQGTSYRIDLVSRRGSRDRVLTSSNVVSVPRGGLADQSDDRPLDAADELIAHAGILDLDVPSFGNRIPHRVISYVDDQYGES